MVGYKTKIIIALLFAHSIWLTNETLDEAKNTDKSTKLKYEIPDEVGNENSVISSMDYWFTGTPSSQIDRISDKDGLKKSDTKSNREIVKTVDSSASSDTSSSDNSTSASSSTDSSSDLSDAGVKSKNADITDENLEQATGYLIDNYWFMGNLRSQKEKMVDKNLSRAKSIETWVHTDSSVSSDTFISANSSLSSSSEEYSTPNTSAITEPPKIESNRRKVDNANTDDYRLKGISSSQADRVMVEKNISSESPLPTESFQGDLPNNSIDAFEYAATIDVDDVAEKFTKNQDTQEDGAFRDFIIEFKQNRKEDHIVWLDIPDYMKYDDFRLIGKDAERAMITSRTYGFVNLDYNQQRIDNVVNYIEDNKHKYKITDESITCDQFKDRNVEYKIDLCINLVNESAILRKNGIIFDRNANANEIDRAIATIHSNIDKKLEMYATVVGCPTIHKQSGQFSWLYFLPIRYENSAIDDYTFVFDRIEKSDGNLHLLTNSLSKIVFEDEKPKKSKKLWYRKFFDFFLPCKNKT